MKKIHKFIIIITVAIFILSAGLFLYFAYLFDETAFSVSEMEWIEQNRGSLIQVDVPNNINVFGHGGRGVFFDFFERLENYTELRFHQNATLIGASSSSNIGFIITEEFIENALKIYQDHFILVGKNHEIIPYYRAISGSQVGILAEHLSRIESSYSENINYQEFEDRSALINALKETEVAFIIVPKMEYLNTVLEEEFSVVYHFNDLVINYYLTFGENAILNSILEKFFHRYMRNDFETVYYSYKYDLFIQALGLTQAQTDSLTNRVYTYGFVASTPLQTTRGLRHGGIMIEYLRSFSRLTNVEFNFIQYNSYPNLVRDFNNGEIDLVLSNESHNMNFYRIPTGLPQRYYVVSPLEVRLNMNNISDLIQTNQEVTVMANTELYHYLTTMHQIEVNSVYSSGELLRAARNNHTLVVDSFLYHYYRNRGINNHTVRFIGYLDNNYSFNYQNNNDAFYQMFSAYINLLDPNRVINSGLISYNEVSGVNSLFQRIAAYTLVIGTGALIIFGITIYRGKQKNVVKIKTKLKKDDKLKFIDILTSLKNRNYLNDQKEVWNQNTIYPQAIIVLDLNRIKSINDTYGADAGDVQITGAANILIKTQLDNTEIMRTDGNEFTIYLVGYNEKQVLNYIKKLVKEFKELPYEYSAAFGFSMIVDDLKLIDDAISEALIQMRENKEISEDKDEERATD